MLGNISWYLNCYKCPRCASMWEDEWSCMCDDRCPVCNMDSSPVFSEDLSTPLTMEELFSALIKSPHPRWPPQVCEELQEA
jgi:hypothetical protein